MPTKTNSLAKIIHRKQGKQELNYACDNFKLVKLTPGVTASILSLFRALPKQELFTEVEARVHERNTI